MKPVRIFRHIACEPPGYLGTFLERNGVHWEGVCLDAGRDVPRDLDGVSGLVFMGGPGSVNQPPDWMQLELDLIRRAAVLGVPMLGICLGAQMLSKALGGTVRQAANMEIGWHTVVQLPDCAAAGWCTGLPARFEAFQWHAHTFSTPPGAIPLLSSPCAENQAFALGNILALQFHLEMTPDSVRELVRRYPGDLETVSDCVQGAGQITANLEARTRRLHDIADIIYARWLQTVLGPRQPVEV